MEKLARTCTVVKVSKNAPMATGYLASIDVQVLDTRSKNKTFCGENVTLVFIGAQTSSIDIALLMRHALSCAT